MTRATRRALTLVTALGAVAALTIVVVPASAAIVVYDFENLTVGTNNVVGQDGWTPMFGGAGSFSVVQTSTPYAASTKLADGAGRDFRTHTTTFGYTATDTDAVFQADVKAHSQTVDADDSFVSWGRHVSGSFDFNNLGPLIGFYLDKFYIRQATATVIIPSAALGSINPSYTTSDWYRMQLRVNFTANSGNGSGTLQVMDLTLGETSYTTVISNANLGILAMNLAARNPATWNAMAVHAGSVANAGQVDNLVMTALPEPTSLALLATPVLMVIRRKRS